MKSIGKIKLTEIKNKTKLQANHAKNANNANNANNAKNANYANTSTGKPSCSVYFKFLTSCS